MNTLIIYDETGFIISIRSGEPLPREPIGVPSLWVEIPQGKQLIITDGIGVDVTVTPHLAILEDIPPTEIEILKTANVRLESMNTMLNEDFAGLVDTLIETGVLV